MQSYVDLLGLLFIVGVIVAAIVPEQQEKPTETIQIFQTGETK